MLLRRLGMELRRGTLLVDMFHDFLNMDVTFVDVVEDFGWFGLFDWFYRHVLGFHSYYSLILLKPSAASASLPVSCGTEIVGKFCSKILPASYSDGKQFELSHRVNKDTICELELRMFDKFSLLGWRIIYSVIGIVNILVAAILFALYWKGYLNWIIYYFKTELFLLPEDICWSFLLQLKRPYQVRCNVLVFVLMP